MFGKPSMRSWEGAGVLVTGATGFIGGWITRELVQREARVVALVHDYDPEAYRVHPEIWERVVTVTGDVTDAGVLRRTLAEYDVSVCFHLAAQSKVQSALKDPTATFDTNVRGTWSVLEACRLQGSVEAVVVASSDKAYGDQEELPYDEETSPLVGRFPYDASKAAADLIARSYAHTYGLPIGVTRAANTYGGGDLDPRRIVPGTIAAVLAGRSPLIRSDGTLERDYMYVKDLVAGYLALAERLPASEVAGEAFNFGTGIPIRVLDLVATILKMLDSDLEPKILGTAKAEIGRQMLASRKAEAVLDWRPRFSLEEGLAETAEWYLAHRELLRPWAGT